jgi:hypothetical protein
LRTYYVGMDVHQASIVIVVLNGAGKVVMESIIETGAETVRSFIKQLRGQVYVTFEEGTQATWLYDLLRPLVTEVVVCDPRQNKLLKSGNKSDGWTRGSWRSCYVTARCERSIMGIRERGCSRSWCAITIAWFQIRPG